MRAVFLICIVVLLGGCACRDEGVPLFAVEHFADGGIRRIKCYSNDSTLDGPTILFYESGRLRSVYQLDSGRLEGTTFHFFENGLLHQAIGYHEGLLDSTVRSYYQNGQIRLVYNYCQGLKCGDQYLFDSLGGDLRYEFYSSDSTPLFMKDYKTGHEYSKFHGGYFELIPVEIVKGEGGYSSDRILCVHPPHWKVRMYAYRMRNNQILKPILRIPIGSGFFAFRIPNELQNERWNVVYQFHDSLTGKEDSTSVEMVFR